MTEKIKELETALAESRMHPRADLWSPQDLVSNTVPNHADTGHKPDGDFSGTLGIDAEGVARYHGENSASEVSAYY